MSLEIAKKKKRLELEKVSVARFELEIKVDELQNEIDRLTETRESEIKRLKDCISKQLEKEESLKKEIEGMKHV